LTANFLQSVHLHLHRNRDYGLSFPLKKDIINNKLKWRNAEKP